MRRLTVGLAVIAIYCAPWIFGEHSYCAYAQTPVNPAFAAAQAKAQEEYQKVEDAFMSDQMDDITKLAGQAARQTQYLTPAQRDNLAFMRKEAPSIRPKWWPSVKSTTPVSFRAGMWGKSFMANYMPSEGLGFQIPVDYDPQTNRLKFIVTWRPNFIDNPKPIEGWLAKRMDMRQADLGQCIAWHELGHNYISLHLPTEQAIELYSNYGQLFSTVQEFYADLTALRHASPKAVRTTMMFRLEELYDMSDSEPHCRGAALGTGTLMLCEFLTRPDAWPMIHFPPEVPASNVEVDTLQYIYEHFDPKWSLAEYKQLRDYIDGWVKKNGDAVLRSKGLVKLPNGLEYHAMEPDDRDWQAKRNAWITEKLNGIIKNGRADKPLTAEQKKQEKDDRPVMIGMRTGKHYFMGIVIPD
ncbi:MAG: hypothetical protein WC058_02555 [Phycisphaeraceae bacterium]